MHHFANDTINIADIYTQLHIDVLQAYVHTYNLYIYLCYYRIRIIFCGENINFGGLNLMGFDFCGSLCLCSHIYFQSVSNFRG